MQDQFNTNDKWLLLSLYIFAFAMISLLIFQFYYSQIDMRIGILWMALILGMVKNVDLVVKRYRNNILNLREKILAMEKQLSDKKIDI